MFILLIAGIACLALSGLQLTRPRLVAERERRNALDAVRGAEDDDTTDAPRRSLFLHRAATFLASVHRRVWPKESADDVTMKLLRAGARGRLTAEIFMAGRVALTALGLLAGLTLAHGAGRILLASAFAAAGIYVPNFLISRGGGRRSQRIDADLPHFVDQLAIAVEAGMS